MYRIWRTPLSRFNGSPCGHPGSDLEDETITADGAYTEEALAEITRAGFNAIWLHGILHHLAQVPPFTELGTNAEHHIEALKRLIARAQKHGIKVFIYFQPPRALPTTVLTFWDAHTDIWGQEEADESSAAGSSPSVYRSICISVPKVTDWIANAAESIARRLPELGGFIAITASEHPGHCYSHRVKVDPKPWAGLIECPRCAEREPEEIVIDILSSLREGIRRASDEIELIAWNWSWAWTPQSYTKVIDQFSNELAEDIILLLDFERGGRIDIPGRRGHVYDEYSLSYGGPSERFLESYHAAKARGMRIMTKLQIGTTHELGTVVNLPIMGSLFEKANFQVRENLAGFMGCWNFGNLPSANTAGFCYFLGQGLEIERRNALEGFAKAYFGGCDAGLMRLAWERFAKAMEYFPFTIAFLYNGAHSHTLGYAAMYKMAPTSGMPAGRSWQPDERGDDLEISYKMNSTQFSLDDVIERIGKMAVIWQGGTDLMSAAFEGGRDLDPERVKGELGNAKICGAIWRSTENTYKIYRLRRNWSEEQTQEFLEITSDELAILKQVIPDVEHDPRQGYHLEPQAHLFSAETICRKIAVLEEILKTHGLPQPRKMYC